MALILPKGIVVNSTSVTGSIESVNAEPLDQADIARFWKVYTTTKRRLLDPTAERLENYWWRIWGSRRRELKGATVARLFAQISDGQSFVPLRGPANRLEGSPPLERDSRQRSGASSATTLHQPSQSRPSTTSSSTASRTPVIMPHPILKKTRGPSTTGPRPTARFISPHESEKETDPDSPVSANAHVVVQPPSPDVESAKFEKKSPSSASGKKKSSFVASTPGKKKKPVIVRRQSSQTSQSSADKNNDAAHASGSMQSSPLERMQSVLEHSQLRSKEYAPSKFQENFSPPSQASADVQVPKNRSPSRPTDTKRKAMDQKSRISESHRYAQEERVTNKSNRTTHVENSRESVQEIPPDELEQIKVQKTLHEQANTSLKRSLNSPPVLAHESKGLASLAPTLAAATGQLDLGDSITINPEESSSIRDKGKGAAELFAKRPVQAVAATPATESASSLSRSKSQLTLLLEKDRARSSEKVSSNGKRE